MTLSEARASIGHGVVYLSGTDRAEDGEIVRVSDGGWVFVRYGPHSVKATAAADLTLLASTARVSSEEPDVTAASADDQSKVTPYRHRGCGGVIVASLDGDSCGICGTEISAEDEVYETRPWPYDGAKGRARLTGNVG